MFSPFFSNKCEVYTHLYSHSSQFCSSAHIINTSLFFMLLTCETIIIDYIQASVSRFWNGMSYQTIGLSKRLYNYSDRKFSLTFKWFLLFSFYNWSTSPALPQHVQSGPLASFWNQICFDVDLYNFFILVTSPDQIHHSQIPSPTK